MMTRKRTAGLNVINSPGIRFRVTGSATEVRVSWKPLRCIQQVENWGPRSTLQESIAQASIPGFHSFD
jgi:hypothetical protein